MNKKLTKKIMAKNNLIKFSEFACFECILVYEKITFSNQHKLLFFNKPLWSISRQQNVLFYTIFCTS